MYFGCDIMSRTYTVYLGTIKNKQKRKKRVQYILFMHDCSPLKKAKYKEQFFAKKSDYLGYPKQLGQNGGSQKSPVHILMHKHSRLKGFARWSITGLRSKMYYRSGRGNKTRSNIGPLLYMPRWLMGCEVQFNLFLLPLLRSPGALMPASDHRLRIIPA